jgi:hypothetical protein
MFKAFRKLLRPSAPPEPCLHSTGGKSALLFDWYRDTGIATCGLCGEVFLATELGLPAPDWTPAPSAGGFDGP